MSYSDVMEWNIKILEERLAGKLFGRKIYYYPETGSTNDEAFSLGNAGAPEGTAVIANSQQSGKGRLGRSWQSPRGVNIYTSVILRPQMESSGASRIPIMVGVAVAEVLDDYCIGKISLKWPNDILLNDKKVCGILSAAKINGGELDFIVLGIGINVNMKDNQFSEEIRGMATSLFIETGREYSREDLIISLYENLEKWYKQLTLNGFGRIKKKWLSLAPMIGQKVQVVFKDEIIAGKAAGLDDDGSLILVGEANKEIKVMAGDATIKR
jgi:BirA family transcriptional regulator, biotin operon repressor / biotin---[acetyl-CoA-carboxylase] ligase